MVIYKTTNLINDKIYVGQSIKNNPDYFGSGKIIKLAIKKYGKTNFKKEVYWIAKLKATKKGIGYNIRKGGNVGTNGCKFSNETKLKMSNKLKGCYGIKNRNTKILYEYNTNLNLIKEWLFSKEAASFYNIQTGNLSTYAKYNSKKDNIDYKVFNNFPDKIFSINKINKETINKFKGVLVYDINTFKLKHEFTNLIECSKYLNISYRETKELIKGDKRPLNQFSNIILVYKNSVIKNNYNNLVIKDINDFIKFNCKFDENIDISYSDFYKNYLSFCIKNKLLIVKKLSFKIYLLKRYPCIVFKHRYSKRQKTNTLIGITIKNLQS